MISKYLFRSEVSQKRWRKFCRRKLSYFSLWALLALIFISITAEFWANSKPIVMVHHGEIYFPVFRKYHPSEFGIENELVTDYRKLTVGGEAWALWPLVTWDPYERNEDLTRFPSPPSNQNWLGTDEVGRDLLTRLIYGFRYSFLFGFGYWIAISFIGIFLGSLMGYFGGWIDLIGQRVVEVFESLPYLLILLTIFSIIYPGLWALIAITALLTWMGIGQYMRAEMFRLRNLEYVESARAQGASKWRILFVHCLPNGLTPWITLSPFLISGAVTSLAVLDYLGFGVPAPLPSWGELLNQSKKHFTTAWWLALYPSLALFMTLSILNLIGEGVRDAYDPRT